jgi:tetratricopeptide (TPR) repeat protein
MSDIQAIEKLSEAAQAAYRRGEFMTAAQTYQTIAQGYTEAGDELAAAEARNNASVAFLQGEDGPAALQAVEGTPAIFAAAQDLRRQGMALGNQGAALEACKRLEEAADLYNQAAEVLAQAKEPTLRAAVLRSLSALQLRTGRQLEAIASMQAGLEGLPKPTVSQSLLKRLLGLPGKLLRR